MTDDFAGEAPAPVPSKATVRLAVTGHVTELHVPPLEEGGEVIVIGPDGTDVDQETADRAREAAALAGLSPHLIELDEES